MSVTDRVYIFLRNRAAVSNICPTNGEIAEALELKHHTAVDAALRKLVKQGMIERDPVAAGSLITICVSGDSLMRYYKRAETKGDIMPFKAKPPKWNNRYFDREPCIKCGVRGDIGCKHKFVDGGV